MIKTQLTLYLKNKPGELARATRALTSAKINMEGISVAGTRDLSLVQIVVDDARAARLAMKKAGIPLTEQRVAVLSLDDTPGALAKVASRLAKKRININYLYATSPASGTGHECAVVVSADNLQKVQALWNK